MYQTDKGNKKKNIAIAENGISIAKTYFAGIQQNILRIAHSICLLSSLVFDNGFIFI